MTLGRSIFIAIIVMFFISQFTPAYAQTTQISCSSLVTNTSSITIPPVTKPGYLQSYVDSTFGTKITRVTGDVGTTIPTIGGTWKDVAVHNYSKDQVWNADETLMYISRHLGGPNPLYLDGNSYQPLFTKQTPGSESRWHPTDPNSRIYMGSNEIGYWNVYTGQTSQVNTFAGYSNFQFGPYEGNPSQDGAWVAPLATSPQGKQVTFAYNIETKQKLPDIDLTGIDVDWVSISALAKYIVVNGVIDGSMDRTQIYSVQGAKVGSLWSEYGRPSHFDLTIDQNGDEVGVGVSKSAPDEGKVIKRRLSDGTVTPLTTGGYASHTSTRDTKNPGWALATYNYVGSSWPPYRGELVAVKLDGSGVMRLAHVHDNNTDYEAESHGSISPSGTRAIFASNWDSTSGRPVSANVVDIREKCSGVTPSPSVNTPTPSVIVSPTDGVCSRKAQGDADCNNAIDLIDFEIWRREFVKTLQTILSDFNKDSKIDLIDFEMWRQGFKIA